MLGGASSAADHSTGVPCHGILASTDSIDPRIEEAAQALRPRLGDAPARVGVVLGSGLGGFVDALAGAERIPYSSIPHLIAPTVPGHSGFLCVGRLGAASVVCLSGRAHLYEGHPVEDVVLGSRLLAALGCGAVLLTNAAGGIRAGLAPGDLLLLTDHLNLTGHNPLRGPSYRFVDMTHTYDVGLIEAAREAATGAQVPLHEGVYAGVLGPSYETPAEIRMLRALGADAVGMSTVLEAIALRHLGVRVGGMSCVTNLAAGLSGSLLEHREVEAAAMQARTKFQAVLSGWVTRVALQEGRPR